MPGATSLVELILKKWGDDIAGAAKELEEKVGFPESVANRIATGELPMDAESVAKRAQDQGYGDTLYHGSTHNIFEFNGRGNPQNDWGEGTYLSDSTHDVSENYAGTHGSDFKNRWFEEKERLEADYDAGKRPDLDDGDGSFDDWKAREEAIAKFQGDNQGVIYPVRVRQDGLFSAVSDIDRPDYIEQAREELGLQDIAWSDLTDEAEESLWDMVNELQADDYSHPQFSVNKVTSEYGVNDVPHLDDHQTWSSVRDDLLNEYAEDEAGNYVGAGRMVGEMLQDLGAKGVYDPTSVKRHGAMESGEHTIMFPGSENQIRSVNAAFDPQYTGSNIMGFADPKLLAGTAAGTAGLLGLLASEDADASVASLAKRGLRLVEKTSPGVDGPDSLFNIVDGQGGKIGGAEFYVTPDGDFNAYGMRIRPEHRGTGIMNEAYDAVEEITGRKIEPSDVLTDDGLKFWIRRDPDKMREYLSGSFDDARVNSIIAENLQRGSSTVPMLATAAGLSGGGLLAASLAAPEVKDSGMISSPRSETLFDLTMGARDLERRLEGSPASLLFPSGLVEYLETVNRREEDPNAMTRGMALLDVIP